MAEKSEIQKLRELIVENAVQVDLPEPDSADLGAMHIILKPKSDLTALKLKNAIVRAEKGEHQDLSVESLSDPESGVSYTTLGVWLGDQGLALALMGLGKILELWDIVLPRDVGITDEARSRRMVGMGFVMLRVSPDSILRS